jgi:hypothetical protein
LGRVLHRLLRVEGDAEAGALEHRDVVGAVADRQSGGEEFGWVASVAAKNPTSKTGGARRGQGPRLVGLAEMAEQPGDAGGVVDQRDHPGPAAAVVAGLEVESERAAEEFHAGTVLERWVGS